MMLNIAKLNIVFFLLLYTSTAAADDSNTKQKTGLVLDALDERRRMIEKSINDYMAENSGAGSIELLTLAEDEPGAGVLRDPFNSSNNQLAPGISPNRFNNSTFLPNAQQQKIPTLKLKGVVNLDKQKEGDLLALLQIDRKDTFMVRVGDEISYDPTNPTAAIKIMSITRLSVKVQVGNLGNILIIR